MEELGIVSHRELLERVKSDVVDLRGIVDPSYAGPVPYRQQLSPGVHEEFWGWRLKTAEGACGPEETYVDFPLAGAATVEDLQAHPWPSPDWFDFSDFAARLEPWRDFAVMASGPSVFQHPSFLRGADNLMLDMAINPDMAHYLMDRFTQFYLAYFERMFDAAGGRIDILRQADDLGTQRGLLLSPAMFRTFIKPRIAAMADLAHAYGIKFMFHTCGAVRPLIGDLIEAGVDILDPLQAAAEGMEPRALKEEFGSRLCFHGGICTQYLLPKGTVEQVKQEAKRRAGILGRGGGYILAPCHVLQLDVPTSNILALGEAITGC